MTMVAFQSPVGRLVWGKPGVMTAVKDDDGKPKMDESGKPMMEIAFGVAFPKNDFIATLWPKMNEAAAVVFPTGVPGNFAWKYVDGDQSTGHKQGKPYNQREGYPGCFVMTFKTLFQIPLFRPSLTMPGQWDQINPTDIKTGDYIAVSGDFQGHPAKNARAVPGLYTNPQGVLLIGVGEAIMNAPDAAQMFGGMQYALPPGATMPGAAPAMPGGMATPPGMAPMPAPNGAAPGYPTPGQIPPQQMAPAPQYAPQPPIPAPGGYPGGPQQMMPPGGAPAYPPAYDVVPGGMPGQPAYPTPGAPAPGIGAPVMNPYAAPGVSMPTYPSSPAPGQMPPGFPPR